MSSASDDGSQSDHLSIPIDVVNAGPGPCLLMPIPDRMAMNIAQIVTLWSRIEEAMSKCVGHSLDRLGIEPKTGWKHFFFDERIRMFRRNIGHLNSTEAMTVNWLANYTEHVQIERNLLLHGRITLQANGQRGPCIIVIGRQKRKDIRKEYDHAKLTDLCYMMGNLAAHFNIFLMETYGDPNEPSPDIS